MNIIYNSLQVHLNQWIDTNQFNSLDHRLIKIIRMKNYKGLYPSNKTGLQIKNPLNKNIKQTPFQKNVSVRNFKPFGVNKKQSIRKIDRINSRSIEQMPSSHIRHKTVSPINIREYSLENEETQEKESKYFTSSYKKITKMKTVFANHHQIQNQLNQILNLIKTERAAIDSQLALMKKQQKKVVDCSDAGINTEQIIPEAEQRHYTDAQVQVFQEKKEGNSEIYKKLSLMLNDMGINCRDILPSDIQIDQLNLVSYKNLTEAQIIKIQKFFIKKLAQKIPNA